MASRHLGPIDVERIFLYEENPRHEPIESQPEIIEHLCKDEQVYNLARDIAAAGPNPLELLGVVTIPGSSAKKSYQVWEGNRRVCALKLLNDPDLAPAHLRKDFARLGANYKPIKRINSVVFDDHDDLRYWMGIIHGGTQAGVGRLDWDSPQKERHGAVAEVVGIKCGVVSGVLNLESSGVEASDWRPRHEERYHEA